MFDTGPQMLTTLARAHADANRVRVLPSSYFYPIAWDTKEWRQVSRCERLAIQSYEDLLELNRTRRVLAGDEDFGTTAYAMTLWSHSWDGGCMKKSNA